MMIYPVVVNDKKGGASFKKAGGRGYVELACEDELPPGVPNVKFNIAIGQAVGSAEKRLAPRGPVEHNFADKAVIGLDTKQRVWDFNLAVDKTTGTFVVCLEVLSADSKKPAVSRW